MALTTSLQIVSVGATDASGEEPLGAVAAALAAGGLSPAARVFIEDDEDALERALGANVAVTVIVAAPAGSAPDMVRRTLARVTGTRLVPNEGMRTALQERARRQARPASPRDDRLALLPRAASLWTAPGAEPAWVVEARGRAFVVLPGGADSARMHAEQLTAFAQAQLGGRGFATRTLRVTGPAPDEVEQRLARWLERPSDDALAVTTLAADGEVWVRLRARARTASAAAAAIASAETEIAAVLGEDRFGRDDESLERVVGTLLVERKLTLAVAESCTGGLLGHRLTAVPGSSRYFERGVMVYSNRAKEELLGVPADVLRAHGAVSGPCAEAMAAGMRRVAGTHCALAVTGIAGPDGGTPTKPVGTVFIGVAVGEQVAAQRFHFPGDRASVKWQSAQAALDLLRRRLLAGEPAR